MCFVDLRSGSGCGVGNGCGMNGMVSGAPPSSGSDNEANCKYPVTDEGGEEDAASQSSSYHPIAASMQHHQKIHQSAQHQKELNSLENLGQGQQQTKYSEMTSYADNSGNGALASAYNGSNNSQGKCIHFELVKVIDSFTLWFRKKVYPSGNN